MNVRVWSPGFSPFALLILAGALAGCGKQEEAEPAAEAPQPPPEVAMEIESQFAAPKNPNADTIQERLVGAVHPALTEKLHKFIATYGRMPENFFEFSNRMMDSVPPAPPGMRYEIDPADKSVKIVMQ